MVAFATNEQCPFYCAVNHGQGLTQHGRPVADVEVAGDGALVAVGLVRRGGVDVIELAMCGEPGETAIAHLSAGEVRALRDALSVATGLLERA